MGKVLFMVKQRKSVSKLTHQLDCKSLKIVSSQDYDGRFIITNKLGKIKDNANGWGYKSKSKAEAFLANYFHNIPKEYENGKSLTSVNQQKSSTLQDSLNNVAVQLQQMGYTAEEFDNLPQTKQNFLLKQLRKKHENKQTSRHFDAELNQQINSLFNEDQQGPEIKRTDYSHVKLTDDQQKAVALIKQGKNVFLTGNAGTGKSWLLGYILNEFEDNYTRVCAPTGIAAVNVGGVTIHHLLGLMLKKDLISDSPQKCPNRLKNVDRVIIDEISMCRSDLFIWLTKSLRLAEKRNHHPIQLIVVGDFYQLAPIVHKGYEKRLFQHGREFAFNCKEWFSWNFIPVVLRKVIRQSNPDFIEALNKIREGDASGITYFNQNAAKKELNKAITLTSRNKQAEKINHKRLNNIDEPAYYFLAQKQGKVPAGNEPVAEKIELKVGTQVLAMVNDNNRDHSRPYYRNGSLGIVTDFRKDRNGSEEVKVKFGLHKKAVWIAQQTWNIYDYVPEKKEGSVRYIKELIGTYTQIPLRIGYAITIHKSQGQTFNRVNVYPAGWAYGLLYVSLSRVTNISGLYLESPLEANMVSTSPSVRKFYHWLTFSMTS